MATPMYGYGVPAGDGGTTTIINQDEQMILDRCVSSVPVTVAPGGMEDDSRCVGVFRRADVAGS